MRSPHSRHWLAFPCSLGITSVSGNGVVLSWIQGTDSETPAAALSYSVRVGTTAGGIEILSPHSNPATDRRLLPAMGNVFQALVKPLTNLAPNQTYYWSVQTVDSAYAGSSFAPEHTFVISAPPAIIESSFDQGQVVLRCGATPGVIHFVETSSDMEQWSIAESFVPGADGIFDYGDGSPPANASRFYRLRSP